MMARRPGDIVVLRELTGGRICVNLERPPEPTPLGFDYVDHEFDVFVHADGTWEYEDEDEFEEARRIGLLTPDEADRAGGGTARRGADRALGATLFRRLGTLAAESLLAGPRASPGVGRRGLT